MYRETDELAEIVGFLESKSEVNPKEIALAKRKEMKKKGEIKSPGKKKGRKGRVFAENDIMKYKSNTHPRLWATLTNFRGLAFAHIYLSKAIESEPLLSNIVHLNSFRPW